MLFYPAARELTALPKSFSWIWGAISKRERGGEERKRKIREGTEWTEENIPRNNFSVIALRHGVRWSEPPATKWNHCAHKYNATTKTSKRLISPRALFLATPKMPPGLASASPTVRPSVVPASAWPVRSDWSNPPGSRAASFSFKIPQFPCIRAAATDARLAANGRHDTAATCSRCVELFLAHYPVCGRNWSIHYRRTAINANFLSRSYKQCWIIV